MTSIIVQTTRQPLNYFRIIYNILKIQKYIPAVNLKYTTNVDAMDAFTNDLIMKHKAKLNNNSENTINDIINTTDLKYKEVNSMTDIELDMHISQLLSKQSNIQIEQAVLQCLDSRKFISESTVKKLFRHYSVVGKPDIILVLQRYCSKVDPNLYKRNAEFMHYLAKAHCMKGNSEKGLSILKECYKIFESRRSVYRLLFRDLIQDSVLHRSEASLVIFKKYALEFSEVWKEHYPLVCFWHICWCSTWYSDQMLAEELLNSSVPLQMIVRDKSLAFSITILRDYNEDAVVRLLQTLLKYNMIDEYSKVLQVLFTYKLKNRDIRGCTEIIRNCEILGVSLTSEQQGMYITMLIYGESGEKKPVVAKPPLKDFKLKF